MKEFPSQTELAGSLDDYIGIQCLLLVSYGIIALKCLSKISGVKSISNIKRVIDVTFKRYE